MPTVDYADVLASEGRHEEAFKLLIEEGHYQKVCLIARAVIRKDKSNVDAWWYLAIAQHSQGKLKDAIDSLKKVLKINPRFASGWTKYGLLLAANNQPDEGLRALSHALQMNPYEVDAAREAARICNEQEDVDGVIHYLAGLDLIGQADGNDLNRLGIVYWKKKYYGKAIDCYHRSASKLRSCAPYFNLALVYNHAEISQDVDAIDCLERAISIDPNFEKAKKLLAKIKPRLEKLAQKTLQEGAIGLPKEDWYQFYVNPFQLLVGYNYDFGIDAYDTKQIQRLKRGLIQEIELEDGKIHYLDGLTIDKSRAISICDELNDKNLKRYHWLVFSSPHLLGFLTRGEIRHFLCLEDYRPLDLLDELDDKCSGFREWLGQFFAKQYDLVLTRALINKRISLIESLFDGRRWVAHEYQERCYEGAKRKVEELLLPLRKLAEGSKAKKPSIDQIDTILDKSGVLTIINLLPQPFRDLQTETVSLIRSIAITTCNEHQEIDLSKQILTLVKKFNFKSVALIQQLSEDFKQIDKLSKMERQHEFKSQIGGVKAEITKEGVRHGSTFITADKVVGIRWGIVINQSQYTEEYKFLMACRDTTGQEAKFFWTAERTRLLGISTVTGTFPGPLDIRTLPGRVDENALFDDLRSMLKTKTPNRNLDNVDIQEKIFNSLVNAALNYVVPLLYEKIKSQLDAGDGVKIGTCYLSTNGLTFEKPGWFFKKQIMIPWSQVKTTMSNGVMTVSDQANPKLSTEMIIRDTENTIILQTLSRHFK